GWVGYVRAEERRKNVENAKSQAEQAEAEAKRAESTAEKAKNDAQQMSEKLKANLDLSLKTFETVFVAAGGTDRQGLGIPLPPPPDRGHGGPKKDGPGGPDFGPGFGPPPKKGGPGGLGSPEESASDKAAILEAVLNFYDK